MANKLMSFLKTNKKFFIAVIALLELAAIFCSITFSWIEGVRTGRLDDVASTVTAGDGIIFTDLSGSVISSLQLDMTNLTECSSLDGRDFFFPTSDSVNDGTSSKMRYRAGTDADKNTKKYISVDFNIITSSMANLYIDDNSSISCKNESVRKALRVSLNFNDGTAPVLLCGLDGYKRDYTNFQPVTSITDDGIASTGVVTAGSITDYTVNGTGVLKSLQAGESKRVTLNIWLEGTDEACSSDVITKDTENDLLVELILTTGSNYNKIVTFVDYTPNRWVSNKVDANSSIKMFAIDKDSDTGQNYISAKRYPMTKIDDITYTAKLPDNVTNVIFGRFDPYDSLKKFNIWGATQSMGESNTYYAIGRGRSVDGTTVNVESNYGYWVDPSLSSEQLPDIIEVRLKETPLSRTLKFTNTNSWSNVYAYFYNNGTKVGDSWPGSLMTADGTYSPDRKTNYEITIPDGATGVIFNEGDGQPQTVDIDLTNSTTAGYYLDGGQDENNKYKVQEWNTTRPPVSNVKIFANNGDTNAYFTSGRYGSTLSTLTTVGGRFDPLSDLDLYTNYGLAMHWVSSESQYSMLLPRDAVIIFNGQTGNKSNKINLADVAKGKSKVVFEFIDSKCYTIQATN